MPRPLLCPPCPRDALERVLRAQDGALFPSPTRTSGSQGWTSSSSPRRRCWKDRVPDGVGRGWDTSSRGLPAGPAFLKVLGWGRFGGGAGPSSIWAKPSGNSSPSPLTHCTSRTEGGSVAAPAGRRRHCSAEGGHPEGSGGTGEPEGGTRVFLTCQGGPLRLISAPAPPRGQQRGPHPLGAGACSPGGPGSPPTPADKCPGRGCGGRNGAGLPRWRREGLWGASGAHPGGQRSGEHGERGVGVLETPLPVHPPCI